MSSGQVVRPRFVIINECDAPCRKLVAELVNDKYYYMIRSQDPVMKKYDGMTPQNPTNVEDFGFSITIHDEFARFVRTGDSRASYSDGKHRRWQDYHSEFLYPLVRL